MEAITAAAIIVALAQGLSQVGGKLLEKGVIEPALRPAIEMIKKWLGRAVASKEEDEALRKAFNAALEAYQCTIGDGEQQAQALLDSLHVLTIEENSDLRAETARALWLMDGLQATQTPQTLPAALALPPEMHRSLAAFLWQLRRQLATQEPFKALFDFDQSMALRCALVEMSDFVALLAETVEPTAEGAAVRVRLVEPAPDAAELARLRRVYLDYLADDCRWLEFSGIMQVRDFPRLPVAEVFVPLRVTPPVQLRLEYALLEAERIEQKMPLQELLLRHARLVVLGDPGSGKTTFLKYVALALAEGHAAAQERLGLAPDDARGLNFDAAPDTRFWLPVLLPIAAYVEALKKDPTLSLPDFLPTYFRGRALPDLGPLLRAELAAGRCLLLFDGLDEVGTPGERRLAAGRLADLARACPGNRLVVTSRIAGYDQAPLSGAEFTHLTIQPFDADDIARFARQWCLAYELRGEAARADAESRAEARAGRLVADIQSDANITRLAANPLLLSILALIHYQGAQLPRRRVELYSLCVKTLAETWNRARGLGDRPINLYLGDEPLDERFVVDVLGPVAYWMHEHCPERVVERRDLEKQLAQQLMRRQPMSEMRVRSMAADFIQLMVEKTGLLAARGLNLFGFLHLTFEEYLAARYLIDWLDYETEAQHLAADPRWWEVVRLGAAALSGRYVGRLVAAVLDASLTGQQRGRDAVLAGWCAVDAGRPAVGPTVMTRLIPRLEQVMRGTDDDGRPFDPPLIPAVTRAEAGRVLADLGWLPADLDEMIDIPAGEFLMGSTLAEIEQLKTKVKTAIEQGELKLWGLGPDELYNLLFGWFDNEVPQYQVYVPAFRLAKYPVTNAQFRCFIEGGGYRNEAHWSPEGRAWLHREPKDEADLPGYRQRGGRTEPAFWRDVRLNRLNAPVVGVTWHEAEAYCRWLSAQEGRDYRLPGEAMWEKAARGGLQIPVVGMRHDTPLEENPNSQRCYPWGDDFDLERANTGEDGIDQPTAVGVYPLGVSPYGVHDLIGNVWEWVADPCISHQDPCESSKTGTYYSQRGGAMNHKRWLSRCAYRGKHHSDHSSDNDGFRIAEYL